MAVSSGRRVIIFEWRPGIQEQSCVIHRSVGCKWKSEGSVLIHAIPGTLSEADKNSENRHPERRVAWVRTETPLRGVGDSTMPCEWHQEDLEGMTTRG